MFYNILLIYRRVPLRPEGSVHGQLDGLILVSFSQSVSISSLYFSRTNDPNGQGEAPMPANDHTETALHYTEPRRRVSRHQVPRITNNTQSTGCAAS